MPKEGLFCRPACASCCSTKIYATSLEAYYLYSSLPQDSWKRLADLTYPRPKFTHNQLLKIYKLGEEIKETETWAELNLCPLLTSEGLCSVYEKRPLMCRIMVSTTNCETLGYANPPEIHYTAGLLFLQIIENIDLGGLYGNLLDLLLFWKANHEEGLSEVPDYLLSNVEEEELPLLPEEKELRSLVGQLYRREVLPGKSFRSLWQELKEKFSPYEALSFLKEI